LTVNNF